MANLTDERLKEMEEEMNRFEEEILTSQVPGELDVTGNVPGAKVPGAKMIIGTETFSKVQERLTNRSSAPSSPPPQAEQKLQETVTAPKVVLAGPLAPPPPPPPVAAIGPKLPESVLLNTRPPPPPPPPGFIPPQLRHRPIPPTPPRFAMPSHPSVMMPPQAPAGLNLGHRPNQRLLPPPPPPSHMIGNAQGMSQNQFGMPPGVPSSMTMPPIRPMPPMPSPSFSFSRPSAVSSVPRPSSQPPKIVYAAPPVRKVTTTASQTSGCLGSTITTSISVGQSTDKTVSVVSAASSIATGIELNVPVEKVEAEKKHHFNSSSNLPVSTSVMSDAAQPSSAPTSAKKEKKEKKKKFIRMAAGTVWEDQTLGEWAQDDFRLFCGDLGNEVTDDTLARAFSKYPTFQKARVIRDKRTNKTKGFGFVSFKDPNDFTRAMREMNGKYVGNRPIKLRKSQWRDRQIDIVKRKDKEKKKLGFK